MGLSVASVSTCAAPDCDNTPPARRDGKLRKWCSGACQARTWYRKRHPDYGQKYDLPLTPAAKSYLAAFDAWLEAPTLTNEGDRIDALNHLLEGR